MRIRARLFIVAFVVALLVQCSLLRSLYGFEKAIHTTVQDQAGTEQEARVAPALSLPDLRGKKTNSSDLQGGVVVLDFWATWCVPCVGEIPAFNQLQEKYSRRGVKVFGVAVQSGWARDISRFAAKYKMRYPILVGTDDTVG